MSSWPDLLRRIQSELDRCSQRVGQGTVLADRISVRVPEADFGRWSPVLEPVTAELGEALVAWAERRGATWYGNAAGPALEVELVETLTAAEVEVRFGAGDVT